MGYFSFLSFVCLVTGLSLGENIQEDKGQIRARQCNHWWIGLAVSHELIPVFAGDKQLSFLGLDLLCAPVKYLCQLHFIRTLWSLWQLRNWSRSNPLHNIYTISSHSLKDVLAEKVKSCFLSISWPLLRNNSLINCVGVFVVGLGTW